jgi:hypothetical protein
VCDVTRLRLNQLFVGLAIFVSVCLVTKHSGTASDPAAGKFENYNA